MTPSELKRNVEATEPYFFSRKTMKFIIGIAIGMLLGAWFWCPRPMFVKPYKVTVEQLTTSDIMTCRSDANCMDIKTFNDE